MISILKNPSRKILNKAPNIIHDNKLSKAMMREWKPEYKRVGAVGFKLGMMTHYDKWGKRHPVTVLRLDGCQVLRSFPNGAATIMEVGSGYKSPRQLNKASLCSFKSLGVDPKLSVQGFSVSGASLVPSGTPIYAAHFVPGQFVDVQSKSIGKGFQGAMVRWGFKGMPASHGCSLSHRALGATGCRTDPGRVWKGKKMAGRMGGHNVTCKSLKVLKIDNVLNCIFVRGSVGGYDGTPVKIMDSKKNPIFQINKPPFPTYIQTPEQTPLPRMMMAPEVEVDTLHIEAPDV